MNRRFFLFKTWYLIVSFALFSTIVSGQDRDVDESVSYDSHNVFALPRGAVEAGGRLVIGGGGDLPDSVYDEFVRLAGGKKARIVLIPSAYPYDDMAHVRRAFGGWREYDVQSFDFLHTDEPEEADEHEFCKALESATGVWFPGGAQSRLTFRYGQRRAEKLIRQVLVRGGVVGGTSAGASVQSRLMIRYGSSTEATLDRGFGLTKRLVIDQHFSERGRFPRLLGVLEDNLGHIGLGVDENTAVILEGNTVRVMGDGRATFFIGPNHDGEATAVYRLKSGESANAILVHNVGRGVTFDLRKVPGRSRP
jgi:cyanophycinase